MQDPILSPFDGSNLASFPVSPLNLLADTSLLSIPPGSALSASALLSPPRELTRSEGSAIESSLTGLLPNALPFSSLGGLNNEAISPAIAGIVDSLTGQAANPVSGPANSGLDGDTFGRTPLPLSFVANAGQTDDSVAFHARGAGHTLFFTDDGLYLSTTQSAGDRQQSATVGLTFVGAQADPSLTATRSLASSSHFLRGNDPDQWQTQLSTYGGLVYRDLYDGIDLSYSGEEGILKSEFVVHPGADPGDIQLAYSGIEGMSLRADGALVLQTPFGELVETAPLLYQAINGEQITVDGQYQLLGDNQVGFAIGDYDPAYALVIDPVLEYASYLGGSGLDAGTDIAVDAAGNAYLVGQTSSLDFPGTAGVSAGGNSDIFVAKLNSDGSLAYTTYLGGSGSDWGTGIAVNATGQVYISGRTDSADLATTPDAFQRNYGGGTQDGLFFKLSADGRRLDYASYIGGTGDDSAAGIATDDNGNAYITGQTTSTDFETRNALQATYGGNQDAFFVKVDAVGGLVSATYLGGSGSDRATDIAVDSSGRAYLTGATNSSNFTTVNAYQSTYGGGDSDAFVAQFGDSNGTALAFATYLGGSGNEAGLGIAVDAASKAYVTGRTSSTDWQTVNALQESYGGGASDAFVTKYSAGGSDLLYSTYLGGSGNDAGEDIAVDIIGSAYLTGQTGSSDFPTANPLQLGLAQRETDAFVTRVTPSGAKLTHSTYFGGSNADIGLGIALDAERDVYIIGQTASADLTLASSLQAAAGGDSDAFIAKFSNPDIEGDFDGDTDVDFDDLGFITAALNQTAAASADPRDLDGDGRITVLDARKLTLLFRGPQDITAPALAVGLVNDTGLSDQDELTMDGRLQGVVTDSSGVSSLKVAVNGGDLQEITDAVDTDGRFELSPQRLTELNGGSLPDGPYSLAFQATDTVGNVSGLFGFEFVLDTTPPPLTLGLAAASDTAPAGDQQTTLETVELIGQTEPGLTVTLQETGASVTASPTGEFSFSDVSLSVGDNSFTVTSTDRAGNNGSFTQSIERKRDVNTVAGTVFVDTNGNAVQDASEVGQAGVTVFLDANQNGFLNDGELSQVTDSSGQYRFEDVASDSYLVWQVVPDGFEQTAPESFFASVALEGDTTFEDINFGNQEFVLPVGTGEISGFKWEDINANGVRDTDLVQGSDPDVVFVIDVSGSADFNFVGSNVADFNGDGRANTRLDAEIAGFIALNDQLVAQGLGDSAEVGIVVFSGFAAQADMNTTLSGTQLLTTPTTDADGNGVSDVEDILRSLRSGAFGVGNFTGTNFENALREVEQTLTTVDTPVGSGNVVFLSDGEVNRGGNISDEIARLEALGVNISAFGVGTDASIRDLRRVDPDAEIFVTADELIDVFSNLDSGDSEFVEPTLADFTVYLDLNKNGQLDRNEPNQLTGADGSYRFTNLAAETYEVREVQQFGFGQTFPFSQEVTAADGTTRVVPGFHSVALSAGEIANGFNFGNKRSTGEIRGLKWADDNGNGEFDDNETPLENATVYLDLNRNGRIDINEPNQQTDEEGRYRFKDLNTDTYIVREVVPFGFVQTAPIDADFYAVDLGVGEIVEDINFGNQFVGTNIAPEIVSTPVIEYTVPPGPVQAVEFVDFSDLSEIELGGDAARLTPVSDGRNILRLVDSATPFESGNALIRSPFDLFGPNGEAISFSTNFQFQITDPGGITDEDGAGADGITFLLSPTANVGSSGAGIGYEGLQNTVAIEFDTYNNGARDNNNGNHVGLAVNGDTSAIAQTAVTPRFNNGEVWNAWIEYDGESQQIQVWASLSTERPDTPLLSEQIDIPAIVGSDEFFVGFTSATGAAFGVHDILSWNFTAGQIPVVPDDYTYQVVAVDEDSDPLTYSLTAAPSGATVGPATGQIIWDSSLIAPGSYDFTVQVNDGRGGNDEQSFTLNVEAGNPAAAPNQAPVIVSDPTFQVAPENPYFYNVNAIDPEKSTLTYSLAGVPPEGIQIDSETGVIRWTPTASQTGEFPITVVVSDPDGGEASQTFTVTVDAAFVDLPNPELPTVEFGFRTNKVAIGEALDLQVQSIDSDGLASLDLMVDGEPVALNADVRSGAINGATLQFSEAGLVEIVATATDVNGNSATQTLTIRVTDPNDTAAPVTELDLSQFAGDNSTITAPVDVIGTVNDDSLEFYRLEIAPVDLVNLNTPAAVDSDYRVLAEGTGNIDNGVLGQIDPTVLANGNYFLRVITGDFSGNIDAQGTTISVAGDLKPGRFTQEFTDLSIPLTGIPIEVNRVYDSLNSNRVGDFGFGWSLGGQDARIQESVPVTDLNGFGLSFFSATPFEVGSTVTLTNPDGDRVSFTFEPVVTSTSLFGPIWSPRFVAEDGVYDTLEVDYTPLSIRSDGKAGLFLFGLPYNPSEYRLTTRDGTTYRYDQFDGLENITDRNGNTLTYTDNGIFSSTGESVRFVRDGQGRITEIVDLAGQSIEYDYDTNGDLVAVTDREGNNTKLVYEEPQLPHYLSNIVDPLGRGGTRNEYDDEGRLVRLIDADGNALDIAFSGTNSQTLTDPLGNVISFIFDDRGNVVQQVDAEGGITLSTYDADDNLTSITNSGGNVTTFTYDAQGNVLTETDALGNTTTFTYNQFNQVLTTSDALGFTTTNEYDDAGNLTKTTDAEGNITTNKYDDAGHLVQVIDESGNVTDLDYNVFGLITQITDSEGGVGTFSYDNSGNIVSLTTPREIENTFSYDSENRLTAFTDGLGNVSTVEYNAAGQRTATIDALGRRTEFTYNSRGLLESTVFPDGTVETIVYDVLDRQIAEIDRNGNRTEFQYDALDRLIGVVDASGNQTTYERDLNGNIIEQTDSEGRTTMFTYDALDQVVTTTLPLGQTFTNFHDAVGNLIQTNDFNGDLLNYDYDGLRQLIETSVADGTTLERSTYTPTGQVATTQDERGLAEFVYDGLNQLTRRIDPDGTEISYSYDADGNIASLSTPSGTVRYTYDALNLLDTVTDREGAVTDYDYDAMGNLTRTVFANGVVETREYDASDRIEELTVINEDGNLLASYVYTFDNVGNRLSETDSTGRVTKYSYDDLYRVTEVEVSDSTLGDESTNYTYNNVGNILTKTDSSGTTTYTYDDNDRLIQEEISGQATTYTYDEAGNRLDKRINGIIVDVYNWNIQGELTGATITEGGMTADVSYQYNTDGIRVSKTVDGQETRFLIDANQQEFAQVIEEYTSDGVIQVVYSHGNDLISQLRETEQGFYHTDSLGSVRLLTDAAGNVENVYTYDPYGSVINQLELQQNAFKFTGEQFDPELNNYYLRARYYNPETGRFVSRDPFEGFLERPLSLNDYPYTEGNPINAIDPSGEVSSLEFRIAGLQLRAAIVGGFVAGRAVNFAYRVTIFNAIYGRYLRYFSRILREILENLPF
ncbi:MAG: SBBP repeat-containing protein [Cyanobacteria bacterium J06560_6]